MQNKPSRIPLFPFILLALLALIFALWGGLLRLGWVLPAFPNLALAHGPLMVSGFLGVLIPLERAAALRQKWMFVVPALAAAGWIGLLIQTFLGAVLLCLGSLGTLAILVSMVRREPHTHVVVMAGGALAWLVGNLLWLAGQPVYQVVYWWVAFLVLTIAGERLELSRVLRPTQAQIRLFQALAGLVFTAAILAYLDLNLGARLNGVSLLGLSLWLLRHDLARRNLRHPAALTRYIAVCLFSGFIWLGISGALFLYHGALVAGPLYDAALHAVFVGFVISMIFGHAPIIFPALLGAPVQFSPLFYVHLALLHASLALRIYGDLALQLELRKWGGLLNEIAILLFLAMTVISLIRREKA